MIIDFEKTIHFHAEVDDKQFMDESKNNKNRLVAYNRKQKKLWLVQNKLKKILQEK